MVDYSKWDALEVDSDSEDEAAASAPRVTRLDAPASVTIGGRDPGLTIRPSGASGPPTAAAPAARAGTGAGAKAPSSSPSPPPAKRPGGAFAKNGAREATFAWAQDQREVRVHVFAPAGARARDVEVRLAPDGELGVNFAGKELLKRKLAEDVWGAAPRHPAGLGSQQGPSDADEDKAMDWELQDLPEDLRPADEAKERCISITLTKYVPSDLLRTIWWRRAFEGGDELDVDVAAIQAAGGSGPGGGLVFQQAWREAQEAFRAQRRSEAAAATAREDDP